MSWCPKCKKEYQEEVQICPDCDTELVEFLSDKTEEEYVPLYQTNDEELKNKILAYLVHCEIHVKEFSEPGENGSMMYFVHVPEKELKKATLEAQAVLSYHAKHDEKLEKEENATEKETAVTSTELHVTAKDRYQEYRSSGIMLIIFSVLLFGFAALNFLDIITFMASAPSLVVILIAATVFLYLGISSLRSTGKLLEEAKDEERETDTILNYLKENFSSDTLKSMQEDGMTDELLYFKQTASMKESLTAQFPEAEENYIDALIEDYYNSLESLF